MRSELTTFVCPSRVVIMTLYSQRLSNPQSVSRLGQLLFEMSCKQYTEYTCKYKNIIVILYDCVNSNATHKCIKTSGGFKGGRGTWTLPTTH